MFGCGGLGMRVHQDQLDKDHVNQLVDQIGAACEPGVNGRVCGPHCAISCDACGSAKCQCMCNHDCSNMQRMLSSSPDEFPIEQGIAPLVFELRRTGLYDPCWSCEGHIGQDGALWKKPQVWFYCKSGVHLRLLADLLKKMEFRKELSEPWAVVVTHSDADNPDTTYALRPLPEVTPEARCSSLERLRSDVLAIACAVDGQIATMAKELLDNIE